MCTVQVLVLYNKLWSSQLTKRVSERGVGRKQGGARGRGKKKRGREQEGSKASEDLKSQARNSGKVMDEVGKP